MEVLSHFIFVTGGVVSSLGKGICASGIAALLKARGFSVRQMKVDPYLNMDPGTMSPTQHGEVFVTDDGAEADLDLGHYERFTGRSATRDDSVTMGRVYANVIKAERRGDYLGATVQIIPHVTNEIKRYVTAGEGDHDFIIVEVGGTVGDMEAQAPIEAIRQLRTELGEGRSISVHLTLLPWIATAGELKTKPTQHSVRELQALGIQPDILMCRTDRAIPDEERRKLAMFCNLRPDAVIEARDVDSIYQIPESYHRAGVDREVLTAFGVRPSPRADITAWTAFTDAARGDEGTVVVAIVGKYVALKEAYKSVTEAFVHAGAASKVQVSVSWIDSESLEEDDGDAWEELRSADAVLVPGGFGSRGIEGKISAIRYARTERVPFLGICLGFQMAVVEAARNLVGLHAAASTEFGDAREPVVAMMTEWMNGDQLESRKEGGDLGGTMRLGAYDAHLREGSAIARCYGSLVVSERHRHRYEVNAVYRERLEAAGFAITGTSPDGLLPEAGEIPGHPFFVGVQYHPELKSRPFSPHPLFKGLVAAAKRRMRDREAVRDGDRQRVEADAQA